MDANNTVEYRLLPTVDGFATTKYQLSDTDNSSAHLHTPQLFIYKNHNHKPDFMPTEKLIDGLRSTLNQYPIVAGKLVTLENDDIEIHPSDEGILFKETHCEKDISEFDPKWPQGSLRLDWLPVAWDEGPKTIVAIQVTRFANNSGLVLGLSGLHTMADGCGWTMFLHTWAAFVRGETPPPPELNRQLLRVSDEHRHLIKRQRPETREKLAGFFNAFTKKKEVMIRISSEKMAQLKKDAIDSLSEEERNSGWFSTIDAIVAMLWRAATRARNVPDDKVLKELSAIDMRIRIPNFPRNYFGNAVEAPAFGMTAGDIKDSSIGAIALRRRRRCDYIKSDDKDAWIIQANTEDVESVINRDVVWEHGIDISTTDWSKFEYYTKMDFGDGNPVASRRFTPPASFLWTIFEGQPDANGKIDGVDICFGIDADYYDRFIADEDVIRYIQFLE